MGIRLIAAAAAVAAAEEAAAFAAAAAAVGVTIPELVKRNGKAAAALGLNIVAGPVGLKLFTTFPAGVIAVGGIKGLGNVDEKSPPNGIVELAAEDKFFD